MSNTKNRNENVEDPILPEVSKHYIQEEIDAEEKATVPKEMIESPSFVALTPDDVGLNQLNTQLMTTEVKPKTVSDERSYFLQICNNVLIGKKAIYFICRDLYSASRELSTQSYENLEKSIVQSLDISKSRLSKYKSIGSDGTCTKLFQQGRLPMSVDTQYAITQLSISQREALLADDSKMFISATKDQMLEIAGYTKYETDTKEQSENTENWSKYDFSKSVDFIKVGISNVNVDYNMMIAIKNDIESLIKKYNDDSRFDYDLSDNLNNMDQRCKLGMICNDTVVEKTREKNAKFFKRMLKSKIPNAGPKYSELRNELTSSPIH